MNSRFIIIAILIFIKVIGIASRARADFSYEDYYKKDFYEQEQKEKEEQWKEKVEEMQLKKEWLEDTKIITNIDDNSYTVEYLNGKKQYCIRNFFEVLACVDYSLINYEGKKIVSNNPVYRCGNRKIYKDV